MQASLHKGAGLLRYVIKQLGPFRVQFPTLFWNTVWHGAVKLEGRFSTKSPLDCLRALLPTVDLDFLRPSYGRSQPRAGADRPSAAELAAVEDAAFLEYDSRRPSSAVSRLVREYDSCRPSAAVPRLVRASPVPVLAPRRATASGFKWSDYAKASAPRQALDEHLELE